ncbi:MAG: hypothetical protein ABMA15_01550 [Vicinamibacterales bacterium]
MTDYFGALAMRTLEPERGVQPRRRAPFEPIDQTTADAPELTLHPAETRSSRAHQSTRASEDVSKAPARHRVSERVPADDSPATPPPTRGARAALQEQAHADDAAAISDVPHPSVRESVAVKPLGQQRVEARPVSSQPLEKRDAAVVPVVVSRRAEGPGRDTQAPHTNDSANEPVIRIHIGRVDVRAVMQPAPAPTAPRGPRRDLVTLDGYVQQRSGGQS